MTNRNAFSDRIASNIARTLVVCAATLLGACDRTDSTDTVGKKLDRAVESTEKAAADAANAAKQSAASAESKLRETTAEVKATARNATSEMNKSVEDAAIATSISADLMKDPDLSALRIDVDAKAGVVRLYGPAPTEAAKSRASAIAKSVKGVVTVENLLVVKQP